MARMKERRLRMDVGRGSCAYLPHVKSARVARRVGEYCTSTRQQEEEEDVIAWEVNKEKDLDIYHNIRYLGSN